MCKYSDNKGEWFEMWYSDKKWILSIMYRNMASDLDNGYNPMGKSIREQKTMIDNYEQDINNTLEKFSTMEEKQVDIWCFYDLLKRGAIA